MFASGKRKKRRNSIDNSDISSSSADPSSQANALRRTRRTDDLPSTIPGSNSNRRHTIAARTVDSSSSNSGNGPSSSVANRSPRVIDRREAELSDTSRSQLTNLRNLWRFRRQEGTPSSVLDQKELGAVLAGKTLPTFLLALQAQISDASAFPQQINRLETRARQRDSGAIQTLLSLPGAEGLNVAALADVPPPPLSEAARAALQRDKEILERSQRAIQNVLNRIGPTKEGDWITEAKLGALLASNNPEDRAAGVEAMAALLEVSRAPKVIAAAFEAAGILPIDNRPQDGQALNQSQLQTSFIKWSRANLTNIYFKSALMADLHRAVPDVPVGQYIANIGFNRLMSGENLLGASLSSDVDFKLVIDDIALTRDLPSFATGETVASINEKIRQVLRRTREEFDGNFRLTLEVESFTVKTLSDVAKQMQNSEQERNFSATVINNQTLMSGNPAVQKAYKDIIKERVGGQIASRSWTQNLGASDKGSLEIIRSLPSFETALNRIGQVITENNGELKVKAFQLASSFEGFQDFMRESARLGRTLSDVFSNPSMLKHLLKDDSLKKELLKQRGVVEALNQVNLFGTGDNAKKIDLIAKLIANFTVDNNTGLNGAPQTDNRKFIGRADVTRDDEWVYSVKFSANRVYDTFDQTLVDDYVNAWGSGISETQRAELVQKYNSGRQIAEALNKFAVQLQGRIYDFQSEERGATHEEIDHVYDRITASEFASILVLPHQKEAFLSSLRTLVTDLRARQLNVLPDMQPNLSTAIDTADGLIGRLSATSNFDELKRLGFQLFDTLSQVANSTAVAIKPPSS